MSVVPKGTYEGQPWSAVPESYLYFMVNKYEGAFSDDCRREVIRRRGSRVPVDPWLTQKGPFRIV